MQQPANDNSIGKAAAEARSGTRRCPICGKPTHHEVRPFCSKRCADIDLHRWLGGTYAIPAAEAEDPDSSADDGN